MPFMLTRIDVRDYDTWKTMCQVEFASADEAREGRERLLASGVLDRFEDKSGPTLVEEAEAVTR